MQCKNSQAFVFVTTSRYSASCIHKEKLLATHSCKLFQLWFYNEHQDSFFLQKLPSSFLEAIVMRYNFMCFASFVFSWSRIIAVGSRIACSRMVINMFTLYWKTSIILYWESVLYILLSIRSTRLQVKY